MPHVASPSVPTVLHLEADPLWAAMIAHLFNQWPEIMHVGSAATAHEGMEVCRERSPAIVLLELWLPDGDGLRFIDNVARLAHPPRVLVLSCRADEFALFRLWSGPAFGLIWKTKRCVEQLKTALAEVIAGRRFFPAEVREAVRVYRSAPDTCFNLFTACHVKLLPALCRGDSDQEIAIAMGVVPATAHSHRQLVLRKLGLHSTAALMAWGMNHGVAPQRLALGHSNFPATPSLPSRRDSKR